MVERHGSLDIVVNAAGVAGGGPGAPGGDRGVERVIGVNLTGTFLVCKHASEVMLRQRSGSIVNISSIEGIEGTEGGSAYNASKAGVVMLTKTIAIDYGLARHPGQRDLPRGRRHAAAALADRPARHGEVPRRDARRPQARPVRGARARSPRAPPFLAVRRRLVRDRPRARGRRRA